MAHSAIAREETLESFLEKRKGMLRRSKDGRARNDEALAESWAAWVGDSISAAGAYRLFYRASAADIDSDLAEAAGWLSHVHPRLTPDFRRYDLRVIWRFLMRNYAWRQAWRVGRELGKAREAWPWRVWRATGYLLPRLLIAVVVGYVVLASNSGLLSLLRKPRTPAEACGGIAVFLFGALLLGSFDVERRVGRRFGPVLCRSALLFALGITQACFLWLMAWLLLARFHVPLGWPLGPLCASASLFLAHLIQLFWRDESIGDPL